MQKNRKAFQEADATIVALAVAPLSSVNQGVRQLLSLTYPVLADPEHQVAERYDVYNLLNDGYAAPSVFVIDTDGSIVWSYVGRGSNDRPAVKTILSHLP